MMCGIAENRVQGWRIIATVYQKSKKRRLFNVRARFFLVSFAARHVEPAGILLKLR